MVAEQLYQRGPVQPIVAEQLFQRDAVKPIVAEQLSQRDAVQPIVAEQSFKHGQFSQLLLNNWPNEQNVAQNGIIIGI